MTLVYRSTVGRRLTVSEGDGNIADLSASIGGFGTIPLDISVGGTGQSTAALAFGDLKQDATTAVTGVVELATQAEMDAGTAGKVPTTDLNKVTLGTPIATTSGTAHDFTVLAGTRRVTVLFRGVSLSGTDNILVQLGDAGGVETTGYISTSNTLNEVGGTGAASSTSGFIMQMGNAAGLTSGRMVLELYDVAGNVWVESCAYKNTTVISGLGGGDKALSAELTTVRITRTGTDTFDAGSVNVQAER